VAGRPDDPATERPLPAAMPQPDGRRSPEARWPRGEGEGRPIRAPFPIGASRDGRNVRFGFPGEARFRKEPKRRRTGGEETGNRPRLRTGGRPRADPGPPAAFRRTPREGLVPCAGEPKGRRGSGRSVPAGDEGRFVSPSSPPRVRRGFTLREAPGDGEGGGLSGRHPTRSGSGRASVRPRPSGPERGRKAPLRAPPTQRVIAPAAAIVSLGHEGAGPRAGPPFLSSSCPPRRAAMARGNQAPTPAPSSPLGALGALA
jgi:hypothetical protein